MADYTKREQNRADLILGLEAGLRPPKFAMPTCVCGAPAKWASDQKGTTLYFCNEHLPADLREMIENSPLYSGGDPFA
jgi:hypothetical protein